MRKHIKEMEISSIAGLLSLVSAGIERRAIMM
jgi:hypothetical protein